MNHSDSKAERATFHLLNIADISGAIYRRKIDAKKFDWLSRFILIDTSGRKSPRINSPEIGTRPDKLFNEQAGIKNL